MLSFIIFQLVFLGGGGRGVGTDQFNQLLISHCTVNEDLKVLSFFF